MIRGDGERTGVAAGLGVTWKAGAGITHSPFSSPPDKKSIVIINRQDKPNMNYLHNYFF